MNRTPLFLVAICISTVALASRLNAQNAEAVGTSTLTISGGYVYAFGSTELDYTSATYYEVGASVCLLQGADAYSMNTVVGQDNETALDRSLVSGNVSAPAVADQVYEVDTAHYAILIYSDPSNGTFEDYDGFSALTPEDWSNEMDLYAPQTFVETADNTVDFGDTYVYEDTHAACGDTRDTIITEYTTYTVGWLPECGDFTQTSPTTNFSFSTLNSGTYTSAVLQTYLGDNLNAIYPNAPFPMAITSGYRNPAKQHALSPGASNSRHQFGDVVDIATYSNNTQWQQMLDISKVYGVADSESPCFEPLTVSTNNHLHVDWRPLANCSTAWR